MSARDERAAKRLTAAQGQQSSGSATSTPAAASVASAQPSAAAAASHSSTALSMHAASASAASTAAASRRRRRADALPATHVSRWSSKERQRRADADAQELYDAHVHPSQLSPWLRLVFGGIHPLPFMPPEIADIIAAYAVPPPDARKPIVAVAIASCETFVTKRVASGGRLHTVSASNQRPPEVELDTFSSLGAAKDRLREELIEGYHDTLQHCLRSTTKSDWAALISRDQQNFETWLTQTAHRMKYGTPETLRELRADVHAAVAAGRYRLMRTIRELDDDGLSSGTQIAFVRQ